MTRTKQWIKSHPVAMAVAYMTVIFALTIGIVQHKTDDTVAKIRQEATARQDASCRSALDARSVLRQIVILATQGNSLNLTGVPGFDTLSPEEQAFFRTITDASKANSGDNNAFRQQALDQLPLPDCNGDGQPDAPTSPPATPTTMPGG